jgi:translation initiation factor IF-3
MAQEAGLDLVEIAPNSVPPVCKILDYGKYKYQAQKKAAEARKKQKVVEIKEIKLRPMIDDHDYDVKMRSMQRFFEEGDKVKVTLRFRGREMAHQELGYRLLDRVKGDTTKIAKIEQEPRFEGRQVVMVLGPRWPAPLLPAPAPRSPGGAVFCGCLQYVAFIRGLCHNRALSSPG